MKRMEEFNTPLGQAAWLYYQTWFRTMKKMPPRADTFTSSKYYRTFNNFAAFVRKVDLPNPDKFIWLMVEKNFHPSMWMLDASYALYMDFLEHKTAPMEQVRMSINTLFSHAERSGVDVSDVFDVLHPSDLITLLRNRRLSPWLLLNSKKFKMFFIHKANAEQQMIIETLIKFDSWSTRLANNPDVVENIRRCIQGLDI